MIWLEVFLKLVGNKMDLVWKFVEICSNTSLCGCSTTRLRLPIKGFEAQFQKFA